MEHEGAKLDPREPFLWYEHTDDLLAIRDEQVHSPVHAAYEKYISGLIGGGSVVEDSDKLTRQLKAAAKQYTEDLYNSPTAGDYLAIEGAMLKGALIAQELELRNEKGK